MENAYASEKKKIEMIEEMYQFDYIIVHNNAVVSRCFPLLSFGRGFPENLGSPSGAFHQSVTLGDNRTTIECVQSGTGEDWRRSHMHGAHTSFIVISDSP